MILGWSPHASGRAGAVVRYLLDPVVRQTMIGARRDLIRDPAPELLAGDPQLVEACIDALRTRCRYAYATLSFAPDEIDLATWIRGDAELRRQVAAAVRLFEEVAFAGIPARARPPFLVGTHLHTGRLEINVLLPRTILRRGEDGQLRPRSWNPRPPGPAGRARWAAYVDTVNAAHGWADPGDPDRAALVRGPSWLMKRVMATERWIASGSDLGEPSPGRTALLKDDDPRVLILIAACRLARRGTTTRTSMLRGLARLLDRLGWRVDGMTGEGVLFMPLEPRRGEGVILTGRLFSLDRTPDPVARAAARRRRTDDLRRAPDRLLVETKRWARYNQDALGLGSWPEHELEHPSRILATAILPRPSPVRRLADHLARFADLLRRRLQIGGSLDQLAIALRSGRGPDFVPVIATLIDLETHHARRPHPAAERIDRDTGPIEPDAALDGTLPGLG